MKSLRSPRLLVLVPLLGAAYFAIAKLGLALAVTAEQVSFVWPASGLALAAVLTLGREVWPGIWLGAFVANATANEPLVVAAAIATGNTLEAVVALDLLRLARFDRFLEKLRDVYALVTLGGTGCLIAATVGAISLCAGGVHPWSRFLDLSSAWWLGDIVGIVMFAPIVMTAGAWRSASRSRSRLLEAVLVLIALGPVTYIAFSETVTAVHPIVSRKYLVFPVLVLCGIRLGQPFTAAAVFLTSAAATWSAVGDQSLVVTDMGSLQIFLGVAAVTALAVAAGAMERMAAGRRLVAEYAITQALAEATTIGEATSRIFRAIHEILDWDVAALWQVDRDARELRCVDLWHPPSVHVDAFAADSRARTFPPGVGLPGRVWSSGQPAWIPDVTQDDNFPRAPFAVRDGLHAAFGFPLLAGNEVVGVIECFSREIRLPERALLRACVNIGSQIGQFMARRGAADAVEASEAGLRAMVESALDGIVTMDREGKIIDLNPAAESIFGYTRDEVMGRLLGDVLVPEHLRQRHAGGLARFLATGRSSFIGRRLEMPALRRDGTQFPAELAITVVQRDGRPTFTAYVRDITRRRVAEQERAALLERERAARAEADSASRSKDEFLATVSHELRTPLQAMLGWAHLLRTGGLDQARSSRAIETIERNARAQSRLIDDILDVSRSITGKMELDMKPVDLVPVLEDALDSIRPTAEAKGVLLQRSLDPGAGRVLGDASRLQQIAWNLLSNAIKFTPAAGQVALSLEREGELARIRVRDTGKGLARDFLPHVFERFRQGDSSTTRLHGGLGLGLAIVRHLTELHGGTVEAESEGEGKGATFSVRLPLRADSVQVAEVLAMRGSAATGSIEDGVRLEGLRILVVDDEPDARELIEAVLHQHGAEVRTTASASEALALLEQWTPNVLVSDIAMPGEDGHGLLRKVRALDPSKGGSIPAIALTAYADMDERLQALTVGFQAHLAKPVTTVELTTVIARLAGRA